MLEKLLENIKASILADSCFQSCWIYPEARCDFEAPAVFLEIANYAAGSDPATSELSLVANIEARVVVDFLVENAELECQKLACNIANLAHLNSFGSPVSPAIVSSVMRDAFKPEFDAFICWLVEWTHEFHLGTNVWLKSAIPPHRLHINREPVE